MRTQKNTRSLDVYLTALVDHLVSDPRLKEIAIQAKRDLIHARKVCDVVRLHQAMNDILRILLHELDTIRPA